MRLRLETLQHERRKLLGEIEQHRTALKEAGPQLCIHRVLMLFDLSMVIGLAMLWSLMHCPWRYIAAVFIVAYGASFLKVLFTVEHRASEVSSNLRELRGLLREVETEIQNIEGTR